MLNVLIMAMVLIVSGVHTKIPRWRRPTEGALLLTPLVQQSGILPARAASRVPEIFADLEAYSGYITVDEKNQSHLFFLHIKMPADAKTSPLLLWLAGGPGRSALRGVFLESGPWGIDGWGRHYLRSSTLLTLTNIIYLDQPAGAGYSIMEDIYGYPRTLDMVADSIEEFLKQFLQLFPEYEGREFYVAGEGYGARAAVGIVHRLIKSEKVKNLTVSGTMLGSGYLPPLLDAFDSSEFLHGVQMLDENGYETFKKEFESIRKYARIRIPSFASNHLERAIHDLFYQLTGHTHQGNVLVRGQPPEIAKYEAYVKHERVRTALHVGDLAKLDGNVQAIYNRLGPNDYQDNITSRLVEVLESHRVLVYSGQLDTLVPAVNIERYLRSLNWTLADSFRKEKRLFWSTRERPHELAGYVTTTGNFTFAVVRGAGHYAFMDATEEVSDLYRRFIYSDFEFLKKKALGSG